MLIVLITVVAFLLAAIVICYGRRSRRPMQRLMACKTKLIKLSKKNDYRPNEKIDSLLKAIYTLLNNFIMKSNQACAYQAVDLLKLAFAERFWRTDEPLRLTGIVVAALKARQPDIASIALDAFRPMLLHKEINFVPQICEQVSIICTIALKEKQHFLVAKASEHIFYILDNPNWLTNSNITNAALGGLKVVGIAAIKHHDAAFIREIGAKIVTLHAMDEYAASQLTNVLKSWMYHIVKYNDEAIFKELSGTIDQLFVLERLKGTNLIVLLKEWKDLAGCAALNPDLSLAALISGHMLLLGIQQSNLRLWTKAVQSVIEVIKIALSRGNLEDAFPIVQVLMESGRRLMLGIEHGHQFDEFSPQAIYIMIRECAMLTEYIARINMTSTSAEVILELFNKWMTCPETQNYAKSGRKFCQLLLIYWQHSKKRQAKRTLYDVKSLAEPTLITPIDRQLLGL